MSSPMREHLQVWYDRWLKTNADTKLFYVDKRSSGEVYLSQVRYIRDELSGLAWRDVAYDSRPPSTPSDDLKETAWVIGEHCSKSVVLPVYSIERPTLGLRLVLRYNFYDWCVSVESETAVRDWVSGYDRGLLCFFEGFPDELKFGTYAESQRRFSLAIRDDYELYAFVRQLMTERR
jgi:hypothetical protein